MDLAEMVSELLDTPDEKLVKPDPLSKLPVVEKIITRDEDSYFVTYKSKGHAHTMRCSAVAINGPCLLIEGNVVTTAFIQMELEEGQVHTL